VLGHIFDRFGWAACVAGIGLSLAAAALLAGRLDSAPLSTRQRSGISPRFPASA
jgi:YNFM family putative membrane transporter